MPWQLPDGFNEGAPAAQRRRIVPGTIPASGPMEKCPDCQEAPTVVHRLSDGSCYVRCPVSACHWTTAPAPYPEAAQKTWNTFCRREGLRRREADHNREAVQECLKAQPA